MKRYELSHQKNIRDIGGLVGYNGLHIKYGHIYRGGALHKVNDDDIQILNTFHLTDVIDFRGEDEFIHQPDVRLEGVTYHSCPAIEEKIKKEDRKNDDGNLLWFVEASTKGHDHMVEQYARLITMEKSQRAFAHLFQILLEGENKVVYYHCSQGKDRAGLATFLIETALGVSYEDRISDYLLSNEAMKDRVEKILGDIKYKKYYNEEYHQKLLDVFAAKEEYLEAAINEMNNRYGGVLNFIKNVLNVDIDRLRKLYLE